jgi:hypothetical protein
MTARGNAAAIDPDAGTGRVETNGRLEGVAPRNRLTSHHCLSVNAFGVL